MLGDADRNTVGVHFLEGVGADHRGRHLAGDADQRNGVETRIGNGGDEVGGTRPATGHTNRRFALSSRHTLSNKARALFVTGQYVPDLRALA